MDAPSQPRGSTLNKPLYYNHRRFSPGSIYPVRRSAVYAGGSSISRRGGMIARASSHAMRLRASSLY